MSGEEAEVFPNAKPPLLGSDTHAANLSGSVIALNPVISINWKDASTGGGTGDFDSAEKVYASVVVTATQPINSIFIRQFSPMDRNNNGGTFRIREDDINGAVIASTGYGAGNGPAFITMSAIVKNQPVGARTYVMTRQQNPTTGFTRLQGGSTSNSFIVDVDDTHAAALTGANTQKTIPQGGIPS